EVGDRVPIIAGVYADGTQEAITLARDARAAGAQGLLVFPPTIFMWGAQVKPDMVLRHFSTLADAVDLPLIVFEYPPVSGLGYSPETLGELCKIQRGRREGLIERHRGLREEPPRPPRLGTPGGHALLVHH